MTQVIQVPPLGNSSGPAPCTFCSIAPQTYNTVTRGAWHSSLSIPAQMAQLNLPGGRTPRHCWLRQCLLPRCPGHSCLLSPLLPTPWQSAQCLWCTGHQRGSSVRVPLLTGQLCLNRGMRISPSFAQSSCFPPPAIKILLPCLPPSPSRHLPLLSLELPCSCRAGQTIGCFREIHFWANLPCISVSLTL